MTSINPALLEPGSTVVFYSTSPDKIENYRRIFENYDVNFFTLDELGIPPTKTPEDNSNYDDHVQEKGHELLNIFGASVPNGDAGHSIFDKVKEVLKSKGIDDGRIVGMVEDSGLSIVAETNAEKTAVQFMKEELRRRIIKDDDPKKENYERLFRGFEDDATGFPGPDLKLIVETLKGGIFELVEIIHMGQNKAKLDYLRYQNETSVALVDPSQNEVSDTFAYEAEGRFTTPAQWQNTLLTRHNDPGTSVTYDDLFYLRDKSGELALDEKGMAKNRAAMILDDSLFDPTNDAIDYRMKNVEAMGFTLGKDNKYINPSPLQVGYLHGDLFHGAEPKKTPQSVPKINNIPLVRLPTYDELLKNPNLKPIAAVNSVILRPSTVNQKKIDRLAIDKIYQESQANEFAGVEDIQKGFEQRAEEIQSEIFEEKRRPLEDNVQILMLVVVSRLIHPESKNTGIIIDNRDNHFDPALRLFDETYWNGLAQGTSPIKVAETDEELREYQQEAAERFKHTLGESINGSTEYPYDDISQDEVLGFQLPKDRFSVFIGGGAFNNSPSYTRRTGNIAQYIASNDWTLVTGGGQLDGPMGAAHAGFLEYYLSRDKLEAILEDDFLNAEEKEELQKYIITRTAPILEGDEVPFESVNIEKMLKENEDLLYKIADNDKYVPKDRFFAFSMEFLIKQEGSGKPAAGSREGENYFESGNIIRRMHAMLKANTHVYAPGAHGTAQELIQSLIMNRVEKDESKRKDIIIYNKQDSTTGKGVFDHVINELNLLDPAVQRERKVVIVDRYDDLRKAVEESQERWEQRDKDKPNEMASQGIG
ncbi:MAG: hypothetical protein P8P30_08820 [Rickettsiales bacterium]|nr:hypothetical protein [Rickettsiales bacterium]